MKQITLFAVLISTLLSGISLAQTMEQAMELKRHGASLKTTTPTSDLSFHPQGITLDMRNGEKLEFRFEQNLIGSQPEIRVSTVGQEVWYPRLYRDIDLRCFVKENGEIGYDWKMGPTANPDDVKMTMERRVAANQDVQGQEGSYVQVDQ